MNQAIVRCAIHRHDNGLKLLGVAMMVCLLPFLAPLPARDHGGHDVVDTSVNNLPSQDIKAEYVLNMARFVEWPADAFLDRDSVHLCLYRTNSLGPAINSIRGQKVNDRTLYVTTVQSLKETDHCNILFIPATVMAHFDREALTSPPTNLLTIADTDEGEHTRNTPPHILVALICDSAKMGFEINLKALHESGLQMSSELLKLGRIVDNGP